MNVTGYTNTVGLISTENKMRLDVMRMYDIIRLCPLRINFSFFKKKKLNFY